MYKNESINFRYTIMLTFHDHVQRSDRVNGFIVVSERCIAMRLDIKSTLLVLTEAGI